MANGYLDTSLVDKAIRFAVDAHADTERRGKGFPYVIHVLEAMEIVATMTNDPELLAAAALHDTVEDTPVTLERIRAEFGDRVAALVSAETDTVVPSVDESASWRERKQAAIDRLAAASPDAKMVALGDKLSNMRAIYRDYKDKGDALWSLFHAPGGKADHAWHYHGLANSLKELSSTHAYAEFADRVREVFGEPQPDYVDIREYEQVGEGFTAVSYNSPDGSRMIKMFAPFVPSSVPSRELEVSNWLLSSGFDVPKAFRLVSDGTRMGVEYERISNKKSYARAIADDPGNVEHYAREFARMCLKLHSTPCDTDLFPPAEDKFIECARKCPGLDDLQKARIEAFIRQIPKSETCFHGDLHIGNALIAGDRRFWIDLGDFSYGNPLLDLGMFYFVVTFEEDVPLIEDMFHMKHELLQQTWWFFADEYFGHGTDREEIASVMEPYSALFMMLLWNRNDRYPGMFERMKTILLKQYDKEI